VVIATASSPSTEPIISRQSEKTGSGPLPDRLELATSSRREIAGDRRHMLVLGDLAEADDRDPYRPHRLFTASTKARAFERVSSADWPGL
jgi:hypothetical protein